MKAVNWLLKRWDVGLLALLCVGLVLYIALSILAKL